eukprot:SAG22_NODE_95_length_20791_cov_40.318514_12_plen_357_part_00
MNLSWPAFVLALRDTIGAFVSLDLTTAARPECTGVAPAASSVLTALALMAFVILTLVVLGIKYCACRSKDTQVEAARTAHIVHYLYGLYSLAFPLLVTQAAKWLDWSQREDCNWTSNEVPHVDDSQAWEMALAVGIATVWLLLLVVVLPMRAVRTLRSKHEAGLLSDENPSLATQARLGWLYDKYTEDTYYFEFVALGGRAVLILSGILLTKRHPIIGQIVCIVVILVSMALLIKLKPFEEQPEDAAKWSSVNKLAAEAAACQAVGMACGLGSKVLADSDNTSDVTDGVISFVQVLALMVPVTMTAVVEVQGLAGLKEQVDELNNIKNPLDDDPRSDGDDPVTTMTPRSDSECSFK